MKLVKLSGIWKKAASNYSVFGSMTGTIQIFAGLAEKIPTNWLLCDGTEYDVSDYPELYKIIGNMYGGTEGSTFKVPDCRECSIVGAGQNTTDSMNAHDVYELGQFKDDQLQRLTSSCAAFPNWAPQSEGAYYLSSTGLYYGVGARNSGNYTATFDSARQARSGTTTHGKQKGVNYIIHI